MSDDPQRVLMIELRRALVTALRAVDAYLIVTSKRPEQAQKRYEQAYLHEVEK